MAAKGIFLGDKFHLIDDERHGAPMLNTATISAYYTDRRGSDGGPKDILRVVTTDGSDHVFDLHPIHQGMPVHAVMREILNDAAKGDRGR